MVERLLRPPLARLRMKPLGLLGGGGIVPLPVLPRSHDKPAHGRKGFPAPQGLPEYSDTSATIALCHMHAMEVLQAGLFTGAWCWHRLAKNAEKVIERLGVGCRFIGPVLSQLSVPIGIGAQIGCGAENRTQVFRL